MRTARIQVSTRVGNLGGISNYRGNPRDTSIFNINLFIGRCTSYRKNEEAKWIFQGDWEEKVEGELVAGKEFEIVYDAARLPGRSTLYGQKAWNIYAEFKFNDGDQVHEETLDGPEIIDGKEIMTKKIFMPFGTSSITMWFKHWGYYSGETYDSDYGKNYKENVSPPKETSIVFDSDWGETAYGELEKSGKFAVYYDHKRLGGANNTYAVARYSDSSNYTYTHELKGPVSGSSFLTTTYDIPSDAEKVILWFYTGEGDERIYDSDYGKDYEFPLKTE